MEFKRIVKGGINPTSPNLEGGDPGTGVSEDEFDDVSYNEMMNIRERARKSGLPEDVIDQVYPLTGLV